MSILRDNFRHRLLSADEGITAGAGRTRLTLQSALVVASLAGLIGCAHADKTAAGVAPTGGTTAEVSDDSDPRRAEHILLLDKEGRLRRASGKHGLIKTESERREYLARMMAGIRGMTNSPRKILLFVHGGLNSWAAGLRHFDADWEKIEAAGYYPIFIIWPAGLTSTYQEHLVSIRQGEEANKVRAGLTLPFVLASDLGRGILRAPLVYLTMIRSDWESTSIPNPFEGDWRPRAREHYWELLTNEHLAIRIGTDNRSTGERNRHGIRYAVTLPTKLLTSPLIDAAGKGAWDNMLRRTENIYPGHLKPREVGTKVVKPGTKTPLLESRAVLPLFMQELQRESSGQEYEITMVGHSMGAMILNRMIQGTELKIRNLVYMAAACSIQDFQLHVIDYLRREPQTRFYNLMLHPAAEAREDNAADLPPRGSLLYWIDNFLANPLNLSGRTLGRWDNLFRINYQNHFLIDELLYPETRGRMHFKAFSSGEGASPNLQFFQWSLPGAEIKPQVYDPQEHADFPKAPFWDPQFWEP